MARGEEAIRTLLAQTDELTHLVADRKLNGKDLKN